MTGVSAVGRPDRHAGEVPVAYVTVRPGATVTPDELVAFAANSVSESAAAPREVLVLDALPHTAVGKQDKVRLRMDAISRTVVEALEQAGIEASVECRLVDGVLRAHVRTDASSSTVDSVLGRYAFAWQVD